MQIEGLLESGSKVLHWYLFSVGLGLQRPGGRRPTGWYLRDLRQHSRRCLCLGRMCYCQLLALLELKKLVELGLLLLNLLLQRDLLLLHLRHARGWLRCLWLSHLVRLLRLANLLKVGRSQLRQGRSQRGCRLCDGPIRKSWIYIGWCCGIASRPATRGGRCEIRVHRDKCILYVLA